MGSVAESWGFFYNIDMVYTVIVMLLGFFDMYYYRTGDLGQQAAHFSILAVLPSTVILFLAQVVSLTQYNNQVNALKKEMSHDPLVWTMISNGDFHFTVCGITMSNTYFLALAM